MIPALTLHPVDWSIVGPALVAGLLVLATHVPLGLQVLSRGIVFIDLAIAQVAALSGAALLTWLERRWPDIQEALIGTLFVLASCTGILLLAGNPHGGEHLKDLLVGQILWVSHAQLEVMAALSAGVLAVWFSSPNFLGRAGFYILFALAVTASVQLVGVYLVFSSLIMPALAVRHAKPRWQGPLAYGIGALSYGSGLALSAMLDLPSGAVVVLTMAAVGIVASTLLPRQPSP